MNAVNFLTTFIFRYAWLWLLALCAIGLGGLILGIVVDLRWMVVGLMVVLIILPMIASFLYYYYGLKPECYINTVPHFFEFSEDGISVTMTFPKVEKTQSDEDADLPVSKEEDSPQITRSEFFSYATMSPFVVNSKSVIIPFKTPLKGFLWIPEDAFDDEEKMASTLRFLDNKIPALTN